MSQKFRVFKLRNQTDDELNKGLEKLKEELSQLRTAKVAGGTASKLGTLQILKWLLSTKAAVEQKSLESQKTFHSMLTLGMDIWAPSIHDRNLHPDFIIHTTRNKVKKGKS